jgi:hypothetical protein
MLFGATEQATENSRKLSLQGLEPIDLEALRLG